MWYLKNNLKTYLAFRRYGWDGILSTSTKKVFQYTQKRKRTTIRSKGETKKAWLQKFHSKKFPF